MFFLNSLMVSQPLWTSKHTHIQCWLKPKEALLCQGFGAAEPLKRARGWLCSWKRALGRILFSVSFKCRPHGIIKKSEHKFLQATDIAVFWPNCFMLSCYLLSWWVPEEDSSTIRDVLVHLYQNCRLKMPRWVIVSCVFVYGCVCFLWRC